MDVFDAWQKPSNYSPGHSLMFDGITYWILTNSPETISSIRCMSVLNECLFHLKDNFFLPEYVRANIFIEFCLLTEETDV